ncbi:MAG TPA: hypothetical protein VF135_09885 [Terriglobales bacterium]
MMKRLLAASISMVIGLAALSVSASAQGHGHSKGKGNQKHEERGSSVHASLVFGSHERDVIHNYYYGGGNSNLPPGLAKRGGNLPPGLQKQIARNGTLPPGLQKRFTPFPPELERRLPPLPSGYRRGYIGGSLVIVNRNTQVVVDVVHDFLR